MADKRFIGSGESIMVIFGERRQKMAELNEVKSGLDGVGVSLAVMPSLWEQTCNDVWTLQHHCLQL
jgi:hypothetical protein